MENRALLMSYNDITFSNEEIEKYESEKVQDSVLKRMKNKVDSIYIRANFDDGLSKVEEQFLENESVKCIYLTESYGVRETKVAVGFTGPSAFAAGVWSDWGTKTIVITTNKRIFVIYANDAFGFLKVKNYKFSEIEYIKHTQNGKRESIISIKPVNERAIMMSVYNDKYTKFFDYINNNVKSINIYYEKRRLSDDNILLIYSIILLLICGMLVLGNLWDRL
ncbi:hypothetical protein ACJDT4_00170 [Clostridium neuense]|uniref:TPM domain-containing protein n=1 Tax=Clostridium neuense TaxID=1728934 RepID=A0ABW8TCW4_9CLOT